uniref:Transmembrane protein 138 n=1 Tax=Wuchereria bancrofti TaxID=6293 RepID=A0A1I8E8F7_WUCBA
MANKYGILLLVQICMMLLDLTFNILDILITTDNTVQLMLHLLQDALIVLSIIIILIAFSSTFVFQAGLITLLLKKFASTIILSLIYLALSALLHFYDMRQRWTTTYQNKWSMIFFTLYILQRITAILYYFTNKRTILLLSNPKYHHDSEWIREQIRQKN